MTVRYDQPAEMLSLGGFFISPHLRSSLWNGWSIDGSMGLKWLILLRIVALSRRRKRHLMIR
jgi:hypothetical protein